MVKPSQHNFKKKKKRIVTTHFKSPSWNLDGGGVSKYITFLTTI